MLIKLISYIPSIIGLIVTGLFVYLNNPKEHRNRIFALLNLSIALWLFSLFMGDIATNLKVALWSLKLGLFFGELMFLMFYLFALVFPYKSETTRRRVMLFSFPMLVISVLLLTSLGVSTVSIQSFGVQPEEIGPLYALSDVVGFLYILMGIGILIHKLRKSSTIEKNQIKFVLFGLSIAIAVNIFTGFVLTLMKVETDFILFGSFSLFIFSLFVAYAIVKHRLFDIRAIVARAVGYILSIGLIVIVSSTILFSLSDKLNSIGISRNNQQIFYIIITLVLAISYQPIKRFFDKVTNKLFYRDAYDTQAFLGALNEILVANIKLDSLLKQTSDLIVSNIKTESCMFVINAHGDIPERYIGSFKVSLAKEDVSKLRLLTVDKNTKPLIIDELPQDDQLRQLLRKYNVGSCSHLMSVKGSTKESVGILLLGDKSSGNPYNHQDVKTLEIIANELVIAIQNALRFEEIEKFNITLQQKVDAATRELRITNEKLRQLDETKDEFISMASHQLRTPLTAVKGYLSMVLEGDAGKVDENQKPMLTQAFNSAQRMVYLIADLLNVSRLKTGKFVIESTPTQLADVVEGELAQLTETAKARNLHLVYNKPANFPVLNLDETKIRQVIMNFVDNAIYYTPNGGTVTIELKDIETSVELTVTDTGIGVPKAAQPHLFSKFYRADNAQKARPDGTGLGLFMARKVVAAQGGSIVFKSIEGKGSTFGFSFPKAKLQVGAPAPPAKTPASV